MINRISEIPFWGPEEQIRRFINQHDEMSILYDDALKRDFHYTQKQVDALDTEEEKKNELKKRIVALFYSPTISGNKFTIDDIEYSIGDTSVSWTNGTSEIYKSFVIGDVQYALDLDGLQVRWIDRATYKPMSSTIKDSKFTIGEVEYTISGIHVKWNDDEESTTIYDTFTLEGGIEYVRDGNSVKLSESGKTAYYSAHVAEHLFTQQTITQQRIENLDEIYQKQLIWSYGLNDVDDAYFYQDWCPIGEHTAGTGYNPNPKWQMDLWGEAVENIKRSMNRSFDFNTFVGYQKSELRGDEMPQEYDASTDVHAKSDKSVDSTNLDVDTLRHNIMWSYLEVSEWLGDGATAYGSQNGYVSRKMSLAWLFNAIKALINWKIANQGDKWAEADIHPLVTDEYELRNRPTDGWETDETYYRWDSDANEYVTVPSDEVNEHKDGSTTEYKYPSLYVRISNVRERFLNSGEQSTQGATDSADEGERNYPDSASLNQMDGCCKTQTMVRAKEPWKNGVLKVRGNEYHYGERAYFWTHNSFVGECRFFHNARFLGQATFDKEINGTALRSRWADLAEYKEADEQYEPGTLVMFGGEKEVTLSRNGVANAVVTTKPGLVLNGDKPSQNCTMVGIVLTGTAPVKISRPVKKFDKLVADEQFPGHARPRKWWEFWKKPIAITLESWPAGGVVNCITKMEF